MKRKHKPNSIEIVLGDNKLKCMKCLHVRKDEPYVKKWYGYMNPKALLDVTCWRCCRDAESTFLIQQKWPLAFDRGQKGQSWFLQWSPAVELMRGREHEAYFSS